MTVIQEDNVIKVIWFAEDLNPIIFSDGNSILSLCFMVNDDEDGQTSFNLLNTNRLFSQFITQGENGEFIENIELILNEVNIRIETNDSEQGEDDEEENEGIIEGLPIEEYPWMEMLTNEFGCEGLTVIEYDFKAYSFFYFVNENQAVLFNQEGTLYCTNTLSQDCKEFYALQDSIISNVWSCGTESSQEEDTSTEESLDTEYPWITDVLNCDEGSIVTEYESSIFKFIYIEPTKSLYFQDGTFYCQDSENVDCRSLYDLNTISNQWSCGDQFRQEINRFSVRTNDEKYFLVYPNPSSGKFTINNTEGVNTLQVIDLTGRIILEENKINASQLDFNLSDFDDGIYFIKIKSEFSESMSRIVKSKS